jgi:hypothetical protein
MTDSYKPPQDIESAQGRKFLEALADLLNRRCRKGTTAERPTPSTSQFGFMYLDTTLDADGLPIFWQGSKWIRADGSDA